MVRHMITPEDAAELKRLHDEHAVASRRAGEVLQEHGVESPEFAEADNVAGELWRRIHEILT